MRWLGLLVGAALALGASAGPAAADSSSSFLFFSGPGNATHITATTFALRTSGQLTVAFRSDPGSGCGRLGACGYHGTLMVKPAGAQFTVERYTLGGRRHTLGWIVLGAHPPFGQSTVFARVLRDGGGTCADATASSFGLVTGRPSAGRFAMNLSSALASTRCAGPLPSDLRSALPTVRLSAAPRRGSRIDARRVSAFAGHGFAGTVTSTLVFTVGRGSSQGQSQGTPPPGTKTRRVRTVTEGVKVVASTGSLVVDVRGTTNGDVCVLLDSC
jgi:hypothetical protein